MNTPSPTPPPDPDEHRASQRVVLVCASCPTVWEPSLEQWATGRTACPDCGGWVMTAALEEPQITTSPHPRTTRPQ